MDISQGTYNALVPLLSALLGGFMSYLATVSVDRRRWNRERRERLAAEKREALARALDWIDPLEHAVNWAEPLATAALQGTVDEERVQKYWPNLLADLKRYELPPRLRVLLPPDIFEDAIGIARQVFTLRSAVVACSQALRTGQRPVPGYQEALADVGNLRKALDALEAKLQERYTKALE